MRRAGQDGTVPSHATSMTPAAKTPRSTVISPHKRADDAVSTIEPPATDVLLSPDGTFINGSGLNRDDFAKRRRQLAIAIRQRIESRLPGRVRNLGVRIHDDTVILEGQCATYYTKQLAQHAALGILEDERLENSILVAVQR